MGSKRGPARRNRLAFDCPAPKALAFHVSIGETLP
jgi:hypothetical protein